MLELNQQITWVPEHVRDGSFGKWLEGARDWSISRNRFWGSPLPIWKSDDPAYPRIDVYGSLDELERDFGVRPDDLHRPFIDELVRPNPDDPTGKSMMRRIPDVLDCWFESGSMPFAQVHYPFENQEWFESHFPGDFIVEYIGQTRGWFYTLHVLATALFDRPSFKTCVVHGVLLGDDGQKLSKRLAQLSRSGRRVRHRRVRRDAVGAAVVGGACAAATWWPTAGRWKRPSARCSCRSGTRGTSCRSTPTRPGIRGEERASAEHVLDRYVLAKVGALARRRHRAPRCLRPVGRVRVDPRLHRLAQQLVHPPQPRPLLGRRPGRRRHAAHGARRAVPRRRAPAAAHDRQRVPRSHRPRVGAPRELAVVRRPRARRRPRPRRDHGRGPGRVLGRRVGPQGQRASPTVSRWRSSPWPRRTSRALRPFEALIADEANVKSVELTTDVGRHRRVRPAARARVLGPRAGADMQRLIGAVRAGDWTRDGDDVVVEGRTLQPDEYTLRLVARDDTRVEPAARCRRRRRARHRDHARPRAGGPGAIRRPPHQRSTSPRRPPRDRPDPSRRRRRRTTTTSARSIEKHRSYIMDETLAEELVVAGPLSDGHRVELPDGRVAAHRAVARRAEPAGTRSAAATEPAVRARSAPTSSRVGAGVVDHRLAQLDEVGVLARRHG